MTNYLFERLRLQTYVRALLHRLGRERALELIFDTIAQEFPDEKVTTTQPVTHTAHRL